MLYFSHGITKQEARVHPSEIELASRRRRALEADTDAHTCEAEIEVD